MQNPRTTINDGDPRQAWLARLGEERSPRLTISPAEHRTGSDPEDPRKTYVQRLQDAWRRDEEGDDEEEDDDDSATATKYNDAVAGQVVRFRDTMSLDAAIPSIPSGLPTGTTLRLMREQRHSHFGGAA